MWPTSDSKQKTLELAQKSVEIMLSCCEDDIKQRNTATFYMIINFSSKMNPENFCRIFLLCGIGSSCGACKFLRRRCTRECVFAPYFCYEQAVTHFAAVHKVFGASNVSKLLLHLPVQCRSEAAMTISYEALARMQDPIYGCVAHIFALQQQVASLKEEIETIGNQMAANLAFHVPSRESFQVSNNLNSELAFWSDNTNQESSVNQHIPVLPETGNISTNQALSTHTLLQHPQLNGWKNDTSHLRSNSNILQTVFEELGKTGYLQNPWTESKSTLN